MGGEKLRESRSRLEKLKAGLVRKGYKDKGKV